MLGDASRNNKFPISKNYLCDTEDLCRTESLRSTLLAWVFTQREGQSSRFLFLQAKECTSHIARACKEG
jgi:hypothetical protein